MRTDLKKELSYNKSLLLLSMFCVLFSLSSLVFGELVVVAVTALLAAVFVFESGHKRIFSFVVPVIVVLVNVFMTIALGTVFSVWGVISIISAYVIYRGYVKGLPKFETSLVITAIVAVFVVISLLFVGMVSAGEYTLEAAMEFYHQLYMMIREESATIIVKFYEQISESTGETIITISEAKQLIDVVFNMLIAILVVLSFTVAGIAYKIFGLLLNICAEYRDEIKEWRFSPPALFGHFYILLVFAYFLLSNSDGLLAISVANLYLIFMWIYAYVGARIFFDFLSKRKSTGFAILILSLGLTLLSSFAAQILAMLGAFYTSRQIVQPPSDK